MFFAKAHQQPGFAQELEVSGNPGLTLADDVTQLGHRELTLGTRREQTESRRFGGGAETVNELVEEHGSTLFKDIRISLYTWPNRSSRDIGAICDGLRADTNGFAPVRASRAWRYASSPALPASSGGH